MPREGRRSKKQVLVMLVERINAQRDAMPKSKNRKAKQETGSGDATIDSGAD